MGSNRGFIDTDGKVTLWPKKHADKQLVVEYLATKFERGKTYHEREVNEILKQWHTFSDWPLLRRELVERDLLTRNRDGTEYITKPSLCSYISADTVICRRFVDSDSSNLAELINEAYSYQDKHREKPRTTPDKLIEQSREVKLYIFTKNDKIIGCIYIKHYDEKDRLRIGLFALDNAHRGRGIGKDILQAVDEYARDCGAERIILDYMHIAPWLKSYYEKLGYNETGAVEEWGAINLVQMEKLLA